MTVQSCCNFSVTHLVCLYMFIQPLTCLCRHFYRNMLLVVLHVVTVECCFLVIMLQCSTNNQRSSVKTLLKRMAFYLPSESSRCVHTTTVHRFQGVFYAILYTSSLMFMYWRNKSIVKPTHTTIRNCISITLSMKHLKSILNKKHRS